MKILSASSSVWLERHAWAVEVREFKSLLADHVKRYNTMKVGDIVIAKDWESTLHCSHYKYTHAIIANLNPFILVSELGDMLWAKLDPNNYISLCQAHPDITNTAIKRFKHDYNLGVYEF